MAWSSALGVSFDSAATAPTTTRLSFTQSDDKRMLNQFIIGPEVGKGKHGSVYMCDDGTVDQRQVAIKSVKRIGNEKANRSKLMRKSYQPSANAHLLRCWSTENSIRKEIAIMKTSRHGHLVRLFEVIDDPRHEKIYIVMEYLSGGEIKWKDNEDKPLLTVDQTRRIIRDVILGLEYLHYNGIIHRDIKPANLLWSEDRRIVKLIDFGVSHFSPSFRTSSLGNSNSPPNPSDPLDEPSLFPESDLLKRTGTPSFLAPEVVWFPYPRIQAAASLSETLTPSPDLPTARSSTTIHVVDFTPPLERPPITKAIDIWSLAVTLYCLLFGHTPFNVPASDNQNVHYNEYMLYNAICTKDWEVDDTMGIDCQPTGGRHPKDPNNVVNLLDQMLQKDPSARITLDEIKRHPWLLHDIKNPEEWIRKTSPATHYKTRTPHWITALVDGVSTLSFPCC